MSALHGSRRPLAPRAFVSPQIKPSPLPATPKPSTTERTLTKRPRSPAHETSGEINKRPRPVDERKEKERAKAEKEEEFRRKYTHAFPSWMFYFDVKDDEEQRLSARVLRLKGRVTRFFSNEVTHFITNRPVPESNKENASKSHQAGTSNLRSPIQLTGRTGDEGPKGSYESLVKKAMQLNMKIWDTAKLDSVLTRCSVSSRTFTTSTPRVPRSLTSLLDSERRLGATTERDPLQKRHDYHYFDKNSYFVLVEDIEDKLATIIAMEYPITRNGNGKDEGTWPVLYCHPLSRSPFVKYNEKEEKKRVKQEKAEKEREEAKALQLRHIRMQQRAYKKGDLRRTVSMNNLRATGDDPFLDDDDFDAQGSNASGYVVGSGNGSNYVAASGNSVGITSTAGTTSTVGAGSSRLSNLNYPNLMKPRFQNQVLTSRKPPNADRAAMPPPDGFPGRSGLRKSKSTNTIRLPKRKENSMPGYCESCRMRFENFKAHVGGKKHMKFATNEANFAELDTLLNRVRRPTKAEVEIDDAAQSPAPSSVDTEFPEDSTLTYDDLDRHTRNYHLNVSQHFL